MSMFQTTRLCFSSTPSRVLAYSDSRFVFLWKCAARTKQPHQQRWMSVEPKTARSGKKEGGGSVVPPLPPSDAMPTKLSIKVKPKPKFDYDITKTDRNYITPLRAMRIYHLSESDLNDLPMCLRRSAVAGANLMKVYNIRDVEKKALQVHGSLEKISKLEAIRFKEEEDVKHLKSIYLQAKKKFQNVTRFFQSEDSKMSTIAHKSLWVVKVAVAVNSVNAVGKFIACAITGSSAMFAEAIHSCADTMNQCILLYGKLKSSKKPNSDHPYGFRNLQNVTALISGCGVFCIGSGLSFYHGISMLVNPHPVTNMTLSFSVLAFALITEGTTFRLAYQHLRSNARLAGINFFTYIRRSNDPAVNVIFCEDAAAVVGIFIAAASMGLTHVTGSPLWDAFGSIGVGGLLALVSGYIISTNTHMLLGQSVPIEQLHQMRAILERDRMVRGLHDVKVTNIGLGAVRFKAEADFDGREITSAYVTSKVDLECALAEVRAIQDMKSLEQFLLNHGEGVIDQLGEEVDRLEQKLRDKHPNVRHVDLEVL